MVDKIFDPVIGALNTSLNLRLANQNVVSSNIANADTPGYKTKVMEFEGALRDAISASDGPEATRTHSRHLGHRPIDPVNPEVYDDPNYVESLDANTVDRNEEMAKLAENQLLYDSSTEMLKRKLGMLKYAVTEGGGNH